MVSVLRTIVEKRHYRFVDRADSWQEAVRLSTESLVADGCVTEDYHRQIVDSIEKYGPYMVFDHYAAMPHSQERTTGVSRSGIGFLRLKEAVSFGMDEDGEEKLAKLLFTLAVCDPEEHLNNIQQLAEIFSNPELLEALIAADTPEDILAAEDRYFRGIGAD